MKENYSSLADFISNLEWESKSKKEQAIQMAKHYEEDFQNNQILRHIELNEIYSDFSSQEWLEFITNKQINVQLTLLERFDEELISKKLNDTVNTKLLNFTKSDSPLQKEEIAELNFLIKHLATTTQKKTKLIQDMMETQSKKHTFIFEPPSDRDNVFKLDIEDEGIDRADSLFYILEVYTKEENVFKGFVYLQQGNLPVILKNQLSFLRTDYYNKRIDILKKQFENFTLKEHKMIVPNQVYSLIEETNVKSGI